MKRIVWLIVTGLLILAGCRPAERPDPSPAPLPTYQPGTPAASLEEFETILENMRITLAIPGMSAGIIKNGRNVWMRGFGLANRETGMTAAPRTRYHLASLTKPFGAVILMQLKEEGLLDLDGTIDAHGIDLENAENITVRHLMTHTSEGTPGTVYRYNGSRYATLNQVMISCTGLNFCQLLRNRIVVPFALSHTAPNPRMTANCILDDTEKVEEYLADTAQGYSSDGQIPVFESEHFSPAAGLLSSILDLARFSTLLDSNRLIDPQSWEEMITPAKTPEGDDLPYGLGWFIDRQQGIKIIWHYGYWNAHSSLILKIPEMDLAFILLANSNMLSRAANGVGLDEDITRSFAAAEFLNAFVFGNAPLP